MARDHRRLAAIVLLDVAGYSRLMGLDDSGTLATLKAHRRELIDPKIAEHDGRVVKTTGDGLLLEFSSVVDAVRCAVDIQRGMAGRNAGIAPDKRLDFRAGINLGDIIIDEGDIFGDGVNVAARLEALADPGGICVSGVVRDQVADKLDFAFEPLGAQQVKNIARPVEVYRLSLGTTATQARAIGGPRRSRWTLRFARWWLAAGLVTIGLAAIGIASLLPYLGAKAPSAAPTGSIAVLPFTTSTTSAADGQVADELTSDFTSSLQRALPDWPVASHSVAVLYKGKTVDVRVMGRELNVRYLVTGEVRGAGEQASVKARLIETSNATEVWSDAIRLEQANVAERQAALVTRLTVQVKNALYEAEQRRVLAAPVAGASAADLTLRADALVAKDPQSSSALAEARKLYDKALAIDPNLTAALMGKTLAVGTTLDVDPHADHDRLVREYDDMSARLVAVAGREARAWNIRADALQRAWRWEAALEANARAQKMDASRVGSIGQRADIMIAMGRPEAALALVEEGLSLQPPDAGVTAYLMGSRCRANMALGRYGDAIAACESEASLSDWWRPHAYLVAGYAVTDNAAKAQAEKVKLQTQRPGFSIADFQARHLSDVPAYLEQTEAHLYAGLRKAGIPEH